MNRMRIQIPTCQRCCLCLPLRYGLISYGYLRLMLASMILFFTSLSLNRCLTHEMYRIYNVTTSDIILRSIVITMVVADIILGVIFIISCHKKHVKWMSKYYVYNLVLLSLFLPLNLYFIYSTAYPILLYEREQPFSLIFSFVLSDIFSLSAYNVLQIYAVLLMRSEIIKLKNNCEFRFENIAAEAECSLRIDNCIGQKEREDKRRIENNGVIKAEV